MRKMILKIEDLEERIAPSIVGLDLTISNSDDAAGSDDRTDLPNKASNANHSANFSNAGVSHGAP